jgi:hypothetical protein
VSEDLGRQRHERIALGNWSTGRSGGVPGGDENLKRGASCGAVNPKLQQRCFVWSKASKSSGEIVAATLCGERSLSTTARGKRSLDERELLHEERSP